MNPQREQLVSLKPYGLVLSINCSAITWCQFLNVVNICKNLIKCNFSFCNKSGSRLISVFNRITDLKYCLHEIMPLFHKLMLISYTLIFMKTNSVHQ